MVTVIVVTLDRRAELENTILSIMGLSGLEIELIIVDGGSTDGTLQSLQQYSSNISRWISEPDQGIYDAMNKGWEMAKAGNRILYLGAGDLLLSLPSEKALNNDQTIFYGNVKIGENCWFEGYANWRLRFYNSLHHQALLIPKKLHPAPPFDQRFPKYADYDFNQRLYRSGAEFSFINEFRSYALPGGVTSCFSLEETLAITRKNYGKVQAILSLLAYYSLRALPPLRRFRPFVAECNSVMG